MHWSPCTLLYSSPTYLLNLLTLIIIIFTLIILFTPTYLLLVATLVYKSSLLFKTYLVMVALSMGVLVTLTSASSVSLCWEYLPLSYQGQGLRVHGLRLLAIHLWLTLYMTSLACQPVSNMICPISGPFWPRHARPVGYVAGWEVSLIHDCLSLSLPEDKITLGWLNQWSSLGWTAPGYYSHPRLKITANFQSASALLAAVCQINTKKLWHA